MASSQATTNDDGYILVTGGTGYIGSHTVLELLQQGHKVVVVDNLCNSSQESLQRVAKLAHLDEPVPFHKLDLADSEALAGVFAKYRIKSVIHFAALKAVGESVAKPLLYYRNNITGTLNLLECMIAAGCKNIVFSSSATVYEADPTGTPLVEDARLGCTNPYGRTKLFMENIIDDVCTAENGWNAIMLRYFNPVGAHPSGDIGEDPGQLPNNLMPYVSKVAVGKLPHVNVFGNDYDTPDGTGVRDYIHVMDLAEGHVLAVNRLHDRSHGYEVFNLGSGTGHSVIDMIKALGTTCGRDLPYEITARRAGDVAFTICDPTKAQRELGFVAKRTLQDMCDDQWRWQSKNPDGYQY